MRVRSLWRSRYLAPIIVLGLWAALAPALHIDPRHLPTLSSVVMDGWSIGPDLMASVWHTLVETVLGFALGAALGVAMGILFDHVGWLQKAVFPIFVALQTLPVIAFGAIVIIWCGNTIFSKVAIALYLTLFPVAVGTLLGLQSINPQRIDLLRSFGASDLQLLLRLKLPSAMPAIMVSLELGVAASLAGAIVGECFGDTIGIGVLLVQALYFEQLPRIWLLIIVCGILGSLLYAAVALVGERYVWWRPE